MTKTDLSYKTAGDLRSAGDPSPEPSTISKIMRATPGFVFVITFPKIIPRT
jgi:hypothetical protein